MHGSDEALVVLDQRLEGFCRSMAAMAELVGSIDGGDIPGRLRQPTAVTLAKLQRNAAALAEAAEKAVSALRGIAPDKLN